MNSQSELFEELPQSANPRREFLEFRAGDKIIRIPSSVWKDGRIRADLSEYGAGCPVSRKQDNLNDRVARALQPFFGQAVEAVSEAVSEELERRKRGRPVRSRSVNKLASRPGTSFSGGLNFFNPKNLIGAWQFSPVPTWFQAVPQITPTEQLVYAAMIFRADSDGTFRRSLLGLGKFVRVSNRGIQKAAESLENRTLIFKATSRSRIPNEYKFVWLPQFDDSSEQCSLDLPGPDEQKSGLLANTVTQPDEQGSLHKNKELSQKKHEHDHVHAPVGLTPEQEDLINQINKLTENESRTEHFRTVWERRVNEDQLAVFQAIGETRCMKREGKIKRTIGGMLNWHYKNFHKANLARKIRDAPAR